MKTFLQLGAILAVPFFAPVRGLAQGTFINLNFEQVTIIPVPGSPYYPTEVAMSNAMPGWTAYGNHLNQNITYNNPSLGSPAISITDRGPLEGRYTALLQPFFPLGTVRPSLGQVGTIPDTAQSVRFYATGTIALSFGGQPISTFPVGSGFSGFNYTIYGGDVSAFAGQTGELLFREASNPITAGLFLDNIFFSTAPIPEPSTLALFALGCAVFGSYFVRRRRN